MEMIYPHESEKLATFANLTDVLHCVTPKGGMDPLIIEGGWKNLFELER